MSKKSNIEYSKFWLGDNFDLDKELGKGDTLDLLRLAAFRRAIANFVLILTKRSIPVRFSEKRNFSSTDGKVVYINGDLSHGDFDATVGLSLHEAMHIVQSDFTLLENMWQKVPKSTYTAAGKKLSKSAVADFVKYILNVVEDRFIDAWAYEAAPGYRGYYVALYNRYFNLAKITDALKSDAYRTPTLKAYKFRLTNITNPARDLDALPGFREIYEKLDLDNILRLSEPSDRMALAVEISEMIIKNIIEEDEKKEKSKKSKKQSDDSDPSDGQQEEGEDSDDSQGGDDAEKNEESDDPLGGVDNTEVKTVSEEEKQKELAGEGKSDSGDLTEKQMEDLEKLIQKQEDLVNREIKQKEFTDEVVKKLDLLEKSGIDLVKVGGEMGLPEVNCIVVKNMTRELMQTPEFPYTRKLQSVLISKDADEGVRAGIVLGTMLGRRLQVRGEARTTRFNRLEKGKFDRRLIADLGFDCDRVFFQTQVDQYKKAHLHISVDASSSMDSKWKRTMTTVVAMAKAASMVNNLGVTISFRSGTVLNKRSHFAYNEMPYIVLAYDSRHDKFSKIAQLFPYLVPNGSTPEGLAFQAILDTIPATTPDLDSYFVNLSDGEPAFSDGYFGIVAQNHTKKQVDRIRATGIEVLSYFVEVKGATDNRVQANTNAFKEMYGKDAKVIDVENVNEIAITMNKKFLQKSE
jgi:hypothetical protein